MNTAKTMSAFGWKRAALVCLAWAALLGPARAEQIGRPLCDEAASDQIEGGSTCDGSSTQYSPAECVAVASSENEIGQSGGWPQPTKFSGGQCVDAESSPNPIWKWVPMGMVPYIGPRTPDDQKDLGIGIPLPGKGWRTQPFSVSTFVGVTAGGPLVRDHVHQQASFYGGFNFGWDYDHYWGIEKRLGLGALNLTNESHQSISGAAMSVTGEYRLMYYPLGDTRWRPFLTGGVGWSDFYFNDDHGANHLDTVGMIPVGLGLKYFCNQRVAVRIDLIDEITIGTGDLSNFQYVAFTAGVEYRYGKQLFHIPWWGKKSSS